jgi:hypothetical protein
MYPWGIALQNQTTDPTMNIHKPINNRDKNYAEYIPSETQARLQSLAGRMQAMVRQTQTIDSRLDLQKKPALQRFAGEYDVAQSAAGLYVTTGACDDFHFSRQFSVNASNSETANPPELFAFTFECGTDAQGGFWPDRVNEFPKIEREVHAAIWGLLSFVASPTFSAPASW